MTRSVASLAFGRILRLGARPEQPGDVAQYEACRAIILDELDPMDPRRAGIFDPSYPDARLYAAESGHIDLNPAMLEAHGYSPTGALEYVAAHRWRAGTHWHIDRTRRSEAAARSWVRDMRHTDQMLGWHNVKRAIVRWPAAEPIPRRALGQRQFEALGDRVVYGPTCCTEQPEP